MATKPSFYWLETRVRLIACIVVFSAVLVLVCDTRHGTLQSGPHEVRFLELALMVGAWLVLNKAAQRKWEGTSVRVGRYGIQRHEFAPGTTAVRWCHSPPSASIFYLRPISIGGSLTLTSQVGCTHDTRSDSSHLLHRCTCCCNRLARIAIVRSSFHI